MITLFFGSQTSSVVEQQGGVLISSRISIVGNVLLAGEERTLAAILVGGHWKRGQDLCISAQSPSRCRATAENPDVGMPLGILQGFSLSGGTLRSEDRLVALLDEESRLWWTPKSEIRWQRIAIFPHEPAPPTGGAVASV